MVHSVIVTADKEQSVTETKLVLWIFVGKTKVKVKKQKLIVAKYKHM